MERRTRTGRRAGLAAMIAGLAVSVVILVSLRERVLRAGTGT